MITITVGASLESPAMLSDGEQYFFPRASKKEPVFGAEWGTGEELFLHFSVNDTGVGLTSAEMKNLFHRFSQASPKTHVTYGGSGLGLFICKELAELQGGRIGVSSTLGKGSDFKFYVKARRATTPPKRELPDRTNTATNSRKQSQSPHGGQKTPEDKDKLRVTHPSYIAPLNRSHSASQNPVVGSPSDANTLHVLIVEDNLINQKVSDAKVSSGQTYTNIFTGHGPTAQESQMRGSCSKPWRRCSVFLREDHIRKGLWSICNTTLNNSHGP